MQCLSEPEEDVQILPEPTDGWDPDKWVLGTEQRSSLKNFCFILISVTLSLCMSLLCTTCIQCLQGQEGFGFPESGAIEMVVSCIVNTVNGT